MLLVDATGCIDVIIPDLPSSWNINNIYEVRNFLAIMEDISMKLDHVDLLQNEPFTCRRIFENAPFVREMNMPLHLYYNMRDLIPVNHHFTTCLDSQVDFRKVGRGKYHLLQLMHKFPIMQKVKIIGAANKLAFPAGFGRGLTASFHRVIALSAQDNFMLIPASFIVIKPSSLINDDSDDAHTYKPAASDLDGGSPFCAITASPISDTARCCGYLCPRPGVQHKNKYRQSRTESRPNSVGVDIPLTGFILDDGSSSCCCWASWVRAAVFLGLRDKEVASEAYAKTRKMSRKTRKKQACIAA
ncbi:hypothetical protein K7X08_012340 [Anisodus acutangulus]|uniref:CST complex subunit CTC1 n=1 Tax=Anisodus acutangulus TaxID=402998 RepID=A0A9Q1QYJ9_9SOLA|nr:hypothetical protein K7X08_012340 [Anisodus acutangulus]